MTYRLSPQDPSLTADPLLLFLVVCSFARDCCDLYSALFRRGATPRAGAAKGSRQSRLRLGASESLLAPVGMSGHIHVHARNGVTTTPG